MLWTSRRARGPRGAHGGGRAGGPGRSVGGPCRSGRRELLAAYRAIVALRSSDGLERSKTSMAAGAFELIAPHLDVLFPKTFEWNYTPDGTQIVETSPLFGDLVEAVKYAVEVEMAAEDDPIFQRAAPTFEPGTHARRRIHVRARYEKKRSGETDSSPSRAHGSGHLIPRRNRPALHGMNWRSFRRDPDAQHPHGTPGEIDEP